MKLEARLKKLETVESGWSPKVKKWLGYELTKQEQTQLEIDASKKSDCDYSQLSPGMRDWLCQ